MEAWWRELGDPKLTPELTRTLIDGVDEELAGVDRTHLVAQRDVVLNQLLAAKARTDLP
jgi:hypothetical protein